MSTAPSHGLRTTYINWGCRCEKCRSAHASYERVARKKRTHKLRLMRKYGLTA